MQKILTNILKPASLTFIIIVITACAAFLIGKLGADHFMMIATAATTFFFAKPRSGGDDDSEKDITYVAGDGK